MRANGVLPVFGASLVVLCGTLASAHDRAYMNLFGDLGVNCHPDWGFDVGGSCFPAGHIVPDEEGQATVGISDRVTSPTSGFFCQDLDNDMECDDETEASFCGTYMFRAGIDWNPEHDVLVLGDGPVFGNALNSSCGTTSIATLGEISHTPSD